jgi:hypothetical protein
MRSLVTVLGYCLIGAHAANAQCTFPHGQPSANNGWTRMAQAFVPCGGFDCDGSGGSPPNNVTGGGLPSCSPPETYHQQAGSPAGGWRLDTATGRARFRLDGQNGPNVRIRVQLTDVRDANGTTYAVVGGTGSVSVLMRLTFNDGGTDMTVVDYPTTLPITITSPTGDGLLDTTVNAIFAANSLPPLAPCTNFELLDLTVFDPNASKFLRPGHFRF